MTTPRKTKRVNWKREIAVQYSRWLNIPFTSSEKEMGASEAAFYAGFRAGLRASRRHVTQTTKKGK